MKFLLLAASGMLFLPTTMQAQFAGFESKGLVGVGRLHAAQFDKAGEGTNDTLGGFSALTVDQSSLIYDSGRISGILPAGRDLRLGRILNSDFGLRISFGFRPSDFGF